MKIDYQKFEKNEWLRAKVKEKLGLAAPIAVEIYPNSLIALNDLTRGLAELHPHKRSLATLGPLPTPMAEIVKGFAKQGYSIQEIPWSVNLNSQQQKQNLLASVETLKKDTLFMIACDTEPFTGVLSPLSLLKEEIFKKNIFVINYQSPSSLRLGLKKPENSLEMIVADPFWGESENVSIALKGERCVGEALLWGDNVFCEATLERACDAIKSAGRFGHHEENIILNFEREVKVLLGEKVHVLPLSCHRIYDRAILFPQGVGGDSVVKILTQKNIEAMTADSCFWNEPKTNSWLPKLGLSLEDVQSSVIIPLEIISEKSGLAAEVVEIISQIQKKSS